MHPRVPAEGGIGAFQWNHYAQNDRALNLKRKGVGFREWRVYIQGLGGTWFCGYVPTESRNLPLKRLKLWNNHQKITLIPPLYSRNVFDRKFNIILFLIKPDTFLIENVMLLLIKPYKGNLSTGIRVPCTVFYLYPGTLYCGCYVATVPGTRVPSCIITIHHRSIIWIHRQRFFQRNI